MIVKVVYSFKMNSTYWLTKQNTFQTYHYRGTNKILFSLHNSYRERLFLKQDLTLACEIVMWSPSQTGWFPPGTPVSSHTKTIRTQTSVPKSMISISCRTCFVNKVKKQNTHKNKTIACISNGFRFEVSGLRHSWLCPELADTSKIFSGLFYIRIPECQWIIKDNKNA